MSKAQDPSQAIRLMKIEEIGDLFVSAFITDQESNLLCLSLFGRDTAVLEFIARLTLYESDRGLKSIHIWEGNKKHYVRMPETQQQEHKKGRLPKNNIFGDLVQIILFDKTIVEPDKVNKRATMVYRPHHSEEVVKSNVWALVKQTCHVPMLDSWKPVILSEFYKQGWVRDIKGIGLNGVSFDLSSPEIESTVTSLIKQRVLSADGVDESARNSEIITKDCSFDDLFGPVISAYTRQQAIEDGILIDVSNIDNIAREVGFRYPVALTSAVWEDCVAWDESDKERKSAGQDVIGRLYDVLYMASLAIRSKTATKDRDINYQIWRVPRYGESVKPEPVNLRMVIGPGDSGEPVITIMQPNES